MILTTFSGVVIGIQGLIVIMLSLTAENTEKRI